MIDRTRMTGFIRDMFNHVLDIPHPDDAWVTPWVDRAMASGDMIAVFDAFIATEANIERQRRRDDTTTHWPSGHFYSPVVSRTEVRQDWQRLAHGRPPTAIDLRTAAQKELLRALSHHFASLPFPETKTTGLRYYFDNPSYNYGDALIYWSMLNHFKPKRIVEIGSGFSSALALDTIDVLALVTQCIFVDPFPAVAEAATSPMHPRHRILPIRVQDLDPSIIASLQPDDILFVDSSHVVKTGSDVHFEITELLTSVPKGVIVHFHDIFYPFEYPQDWMVEKNHSWNEIYFL